MSPIVPTAQHEAKTARQLTLLARVAGTIVACWFLFLFLSGERAELEPSSFPLLTLIVGQVVLVVGAFVRPRLFAPAIVYGAVLLSAVAIVTDDTVTLGWAALTALILTAPWMIVGIFFYVAGTTSERAACERRREKSAMHTG